MSGPATMLLVLIAHALPQQPAGRQVFQDKMCANCHTVQDKGVTRDAPLGPDLSKLGKRMRAAELDLWLRQGKPRGEKVHALQFSGTEAEWRSLAKWLLSAKAR